MIRAQRSAPPIWAMAWGLALLFALLAFLIPEPTYRLEYARIKNRRGMPFWVVVYVPQPASAPQPGKTARAPAAVVCQPLNDSPEYSRMLDLELVHDGFVVLAFDWRGRAPDENRQLLHVSTQETLRQDVAAAVAYLRAMPEVDATRVVIAGHSVGGTLAIEAGMADPTLAAVASVGMEAEVSPHEPPNLLWALGLYDEFRGLGRMREVFTESAASDALEDTTVGDFSRRTARRLGVSPTSDHFSELQDRGIHREVLNWFRQAVGLPFAPRQMWMETRGLLVMLAFVAALAGALSSFRRFATSRPGRTHILRGGIAGVVLAVLILTRVHGLSFLFATNGIFMLVMFALSVGLICSLDSGTLGRSSRFVARVGLVLWASLLVTFVANNIPAYLQTPRYLIHLPEFAVRHLLDLADGYVFAYARPILFSVYAPQQISPRWWVYVILGVLLINPVLLAAIVARFRRPSTKPVTVRRPLPLLSIVLLVALLVFLSGVVWLRLAQGFLTGDSAVAALRYILRFTVLPFFVFAVIWRWSGRKPLDIRKGTGQFEL